MAPRFFADLHVHSRYSRACSRDCDLEHLAWWAARKGIGVVGTGDFTHPAWAEEIATKLVPAEPGLFRLRPDLERDVLRTLPGSCRAATRFMISTEISTIYKKGDKTRKVHHLLYAPDREAAGRITASLSKIGNLAADGRPILGLDSRHLLEITLGAGEGGYLVPAHVWTPWFAVFGSKSGFDAVEECYDDLAGEIFALETGLSADPEMFWQISGLDRFRLVSNSDAHSPPMLGREATAFTCDVDYFAIAGALRTGTGFAGTVEFFPEEGKYHLDGHRACGVRLSPEQTRALGGRCPECGRPLTVGVLHRVAELADRGGGHRPETAGDVRSLVALPEIVGEVVGVGPKSKTVTEQVGTLVARLGPELSILGDVPLDAIAGVGSPVLVEAIRRLRAGQVIRDAGYDGEYGVIRLFEPDELNADAGTLFDMAPAPASAASGPGTGTKGRGSRRRRTVLARPEDAADAAEASASAPHASAEDGNQNGNQKGPASSASHRGRERPDEPAPGQGHGSVLADLDPDQRAAAMVAGGPLLVVAGPGTGKTRTLVSSIAYRVAELGVPSASCLAVTFTRRAAEELSERLAALVGHGRRENIPPAPPEALVPGPPAPESAGTESAGTAAGATGTGTGVTATTFHALGLAIVREQHALLGRSAAVAVADDAVRAELLRDAFGGTVSGRAGLRRAAREMSELTRAAALGRLDAAEGSAEGSAAHAWARYRAALAERDLVDLDDLLAAPVTLLREHPAVAEQYRRRFAHVWVDEYQDVDEVQYTLLRLLCPPEGNICAIGDPDQAIYSFRGADVGFFLRFREDYPAARAVSLSRSYRSTPTIVTAALAAVAPVTLVPGRELAALASGDANAPVVVHRAASEAAEAAVVVDVVEEALGGTSFHALDSGVDGTATGTLSFADIAVLYRTARQAVPVMNALSRHGLPFQRRSHDRLLEAPLTSWLLSAVRRQASGGTGRRTASGALRDAAALALDSLDGVGVNGSNGLNGERGVGLDGFEFSEVPGGTGAGSDNEAADAEAEADGVVPTSEAEIRLAVDALAPLAAEAGDDIEAFLAAAAVGSEVDTLDPRADRISLLTLHAAKGLEFSLVVIVGCEDGLLPLRWGSADVDEAEERRLAFVGMTRARTRLVLTGAARRSRGGKAVESRPAPFLADLPAHLVEHRSGAGADRPRRPTMGRQLRLA